MYRALLYTADVKNGVAVFMGASESTIGGNSADLFTRLGNSRNSPPSPWNGEGKLASQAENGFLYFLDIACVRARLKAFARTPKVCQPSPLAGKRNLPSVDYFRGTVAGRSKHSIVDLVNLPHTVDEVPLSKNDLSFLTSA